MKALLAVLFALTGAIAQAEVKPPGSIVTSACAEEVENRSVVGHAPSKVCTAQVVGKSGQYLLNDTAVWAFLKHEGAEQIYQLVGENVNGKLQERMTRDFVTARVRPLMDGSLRALSFKQNNGRGLGMAYIAYNFQTVFHTMGR